MSKYRIVVEFDSLEKAEGWFEAARLAGHLPDDAVAWPMDGLDRRGKGIKEFIVRRRTEVRHGTPIGGKAFDSAAMFHEG